MIQDIVEIFEQFMIVAFPNNSVGGKYYEEWREIFEKGLEWNKADHGSKVMLRAIAPGVYPDDISKFFIRE